MHSWCRQCKRIIDKGHMRMMRKKVDLMLQPVLMKENKSIYGLIGKEVYGVVAKALGNGVSSAELKRYYQKLDEGSNFVKPEGRGWSFRVYGMAHPGSMGVANRKSKSKNLINNISGIMLQFRDWDKII